MADTYPISDDKAVHPNVSAEQTYGSESDDGVAALPSGWKYRKFGFGNVQLWYASPAFQLGLVGFVCFMCPGMFNALGGLGGGGHVDPGVADTMNTALYSTFAVFGIFGGTFVNKLGVRPCLAFGGIGYCLYAISLLVSVHKHVPGFNIFAGVWLGLCAGLLWTAQGTIMVSYPQENKKGKYFAWFWGIFNTGAVIGSLIPLGQNINVRTNQTVSDGTYIGFIVLMFFGACLALTLCQAPDVIRKDGSRVITMKQPTWSSELFGLWETLRFAPYVVLLFPMFFSSNWFYTYQFNSVNGILFDTRTKALNNLLYWMSQIIAAVIWGNLLDIKSVRRTVRAKVALVVLFVLTMAIWGGGYASQVQYTRESTAKPNNPNIDWTSDGYVGRMFLYMFYGFYDAAWQATIYWYIGALSNSGRRSANIVGFYKGIQSIGAAIFPALDGIYVISYMREFISCWVLLAGSLIVAAPVIFLNIRDHIPVEDDVAGTDETVADVLPAGHSEKLGEA